MSYLKFDKSQLVNLEYSLNREILRSNRAGSYICTTLAGCNTRKYHGLLICPIDEAVDSKHVLLSSMDETVVQHGSSFNLGIHKYGGDFYEPKGHKYLQDFEMDTIPRFTYRVGGVVLSKERLLVENEQQVLIRYTLEEAHSPTFLRFKPFLAFRNIHALSKASMFANTRYTPVENGIKIRMYDDYPYLHMQFSKQAEFVPAPDWYNNIEYTKEQHRGYDFQEDLFVPGYFEIPIAKGESIVVSASTFEAKPGGLKTKFTREEKKRIPRETFLSNLANAAQQFIVRKNDRTGVIAGFPWYGEICRQTFVALPGITLGIDDVSTCEAILDGKVGYLQNGTFYPGADVLAGSADSIDAALWFIWAVQQYCSYTRDTRKTWNKYGKAIRQILDAYKNGISPYIRMHDNGLIYGKQDGKALTWMDSYVDGKPLVQRPGYDVEVNALWYNAVCFALELAMAENDQSFIDEWDPYPARIANSFTEMFWDESKGYLADYVDGDYKDWSVRPNMIIAAGVENSPLDREKQKSILSVAKHQLLTPRGLRSLSPQHADYHGQCEGNLRERELALHQGTVWPWLLQFFVDGYLNIHKRGGLSYIRKVVEDFENEISEHCIGTISETYNGNPPHKAKGAISQAWSVGSVIRAYKAVKFYEV